MRFITRATAAAVALIAAGSAYAGSGATVYVPMGGDGYIQVIDTSDNTISRRIEGTPAAHGLAITPDGSRLVVGSYDERKPGAVAMAKPAGVSAADHAAHHKPKAGMSADAVVSTVSVVAAANGEVLRQIDVPGAVHHVAVSPDGGFAVVTQPGENAITAIDLSSYAVVATLKVGELPNYAVFSPDSSQLFVSAAADDAISVVDTESWQLSGSIKVGSSPEHLVIAKDGASLYVNNVDDGTVSVVDLAAGAVSASYALGETLHGIDLSDDGSTLFVAVRGENKVVAVNLADGTQRSVDLSPAPYHLFTILGTGQIYVSSGESPELWVLDAESLKLVDTVRIGGKGHQMAQQPAM
jgi:DNA-binding beta-propeller fold protein YncE